MCLRFLFSPRPAGVPLLTCCVVQVAIKFLERGPGISKSVLREILNHRLCVVHPNIVQFKEVRCWICHSGFSLYLSPCLVKTMLGLGEMTVRNFCWRTLAWWQQAENA